MFNSQANLYRSAGFSVALLFVATICVWLQWMPLQNCLGLLLLAFVCVLYTRYPYCVYKLRNLLLWSSLVCIGFFIALYRPEYFNYPLLISSKYLHAGGKPFDLYLNLSKAFGAYLLLIWYWGIWSKQGAVDSLAAASDWLRQWISILLAIALVIAVAHWLFDIDFVFKWPREIYYFLAVNLVVSVIAEETFFRLIIQEKLLQIFGVSFTGQLISIVIVSLIFAGAHAGNFALFLVAGIAYSTVYAYTRKFWAVIVTHYGVNCVHFVFMQYPL